MNLPSHWLPRAALAFFAASTLTASAGIQYVISISVDGLRGDFLQTFIETTPANFPNFVRLRDASAFTYNARTDYGHTVTIPDHLCMFTGRPATTAGGLALSFTHGVTVDSPLNTDTVHVYAAATGVNSGPYKASIFDMVHDRGFSTALYLGKDRLRICSASWDATNGAVDITGANNGKNKLDYVTVVDASSPTATSGFVTDLVAKITAGTLKNYTHLHIADVDFAGHSSSWSTTVGSGYRTAAIKADGWVGQILTAVQNNPALLDKVAIVLTADHGGGTPSSHHNMAPAHNYPTNYTVPFFLMAPGIKPNTDLYQWFDNRTNPNLLQVNDVNPYPPIRNGDVANLAATLVGVPVVDGSTYQPELKKPMTVQRVGEGSYTVSWPVYLSGWKLESCDDLTATPQIWTPITEGIVDDGGTRTHAVQTLAPGARFFRLRSP